jgi:Tol biopolymer transport system component
MTICTRLAAALFAALSLAACDGLLEPGERDQEQVVFLRYADATRSNSPRDSADIYRVNADGTGLRNLTGHLAQYSSVTASPDGRTVLFTSNRGGTSGRIWRMNSDGSGLTQLTNESTGSPHWSPDGSRIAFMMAGHVHVMSANGGTSVKVSEPAMQVGTSCPNSPTNIVLVGWVGAGRIAFARGYCGFGYRYFLVNADGTGFAQTEIRLFEAHFSPDGSKVLFPQFEGGFARVMLMNADGTGLRALVTQGKSQGLPWGSSSPWSPDGKRITFFASDNTAPIASPQSCTDGALPYVVNVDGSGVKRLMASCIGFFNGWSPSGEKVAFTIFPAPAPAPGVVPDIHVVNADGTGAVNATNSSFWESDAVWLSGR